MKRLSVIVVCVLLLAGCTTTPSAISKGELVDCSSLNVDSTVSGTELECLDGSAGITLEALRGPAIVNVWGSWCGPCANEIPVFVDFYQQASGKVKLLGIAVEEAKAQDSKDFIISYGITWSNLYDAKGETRGTFGMGVPVTWFIDEQGTVVYKHIGVVKSTEELIELTAKYLKVEI